MNIVTLVEASARKDPSKPMLCLEGDVWTYGAAVDASRRTAQRLRAMGVGKGDAVPIVGLNSPQYVVAALAIWRLGGVVVPVNHKLAAPEWTYIFAHCAAKVVLASEALRPAVEAAASAPTLSLEAPGPDGIRLVDRTAGDPVAADAEIVESDIAEILYTSGTTGKPKGCLHTHRNVCTTAILTSVSASMTPADRMLIAMPIWHAAPFNNFLMCSLFIGATIILHREYEPAAFVRALQDERITVYFGAPVSFTLPLALPGGLEAFDFSSVRAFFYGGGPISAEVSRRLNAAYRTDRFYQVYGMTETGPSGTMLYPHEQQAKAGSIGRTATPGVEMRVVREDGAAAAPGDIGEIWLKPSALMVGYLHDPAATAAAIQEGWYKSGDLVRVDDDGYLFVVDRLKDMIITGGENVYSKEVEDALYDVGGVQDCAVIVVPHEEWGETVVAVIVPAPDSPPDEAALRAALRQRLAAYKTPRRYEWTDALPRTPSGKVMKNVLRARLSADAAASPAGAE